MFYLRQLLTAAGNCFCNMNDTRKFAVFRESIIFQKRVPAGSVVEHPLRDREVVGPNPGRAIPKALKMVLVATLLGAQHYKASTGFSSLRKPKISHN